MIPVVLFGATGSGKTRTLKELLKRGFAVLDLESLAVHRGSVFGHINEKQTQPSQADFEKAISQRLDNFSLSRYFFIEYKPRILGTLQLPHTIPSIFEKGMSVYIKTPLPKRVQYILEEFLSSDRSQLAIAFEKLRDRFDPKQYTNLRHLVENRHYAEFCYAVLAEEDRATTNRSEKTYDLVIDDKGPAKNVDELLQKLKP